MDLTTKRLTIHPLSLEEFSLYLQEDGSLEQALGLCPNTQKMEPHTKEAMGGLYQQALAAPADFLWHTNWQMILPEQRQSIGSACFMGAPNAEGAVEMGYGMDAAFCGQGYMTEAVAAIAGWALAQPGVAKIIAETATDNKASHRVLEKNGFEFCLEIGGHMFWSLAKEV